MNSSFLKLLLFLCTFFFFSIFSFSQELTKEDDLFLKKYSTILKKNKYGLIIFPNLLIELGFTKKETQILQNYITSKDPNVLTVDIFESVFSEYIKALDILNARSEFCDKEEIKNGGDNLSNFIKELDKKFLIKHKTAIIDLVGYFFINNNYSCEQEAVEKLIIAERKTQIILLKYSEQIKTKLKSLGWNEKKSTKKLVYFLEKYQDIFRKTSPSWIALSSYDKLLLAKKRIDYQKISLEVQNLSKHPFFSNPFDPIQVLEALDKKIKK